MSKRYRALLALTVISWPLTGLAQTPRPGFDDGIREIREDRETLGIVGGDLASAILDVITLALSFGAILALAALVWGGITYIISLGNDQDIQKAKKIIQWAIIGLLVMGFSFAIVAAVSGIFR